MFKSNLVLVLGPITFTIMGAVACPAKQVSAFDAPKYIGGGYRPHATKQVNNQPINGGIYRDLI
jgi:hypothetical protein